ncbi:MAG: hypothetical protein HLUCCO02_07910 [Idiomarinaceae bacterium HL-53]|nr:MAG: hypothetical protein HLUCCO02_07910 [Idiomarinaceae bacterium HL-53]CUS48226.1 hypothetical protein Ga0003345_1171 [Idiomarinaceae bacterium HL-53]
MRLALGIIVFCLIAPLAHAQEITVDNFWLRESIPGQPNGAAFGIVENNSAMDAFLIGADIDIAEVVEVHQHLHENGQMRMVQMEALVIPAGERVELRPGGYHLMLIGLKEPLVADTTHEMTLIFNDGTSIVVEVPVRALMNHGNH